MNRKNVCVSLLPILFLCLLHHIDAQENNVTALFCNSKSGCVTYDGWQVWCSAQQPVKPGTVKLLKTFAVNDYYIVLQTMTLPESAISFSISPEDSPLQERPPNATIPEEVDDISPSALRRNELLVLLPRCFRIPPGLFRKGRWFPFGTPAGMNCRAPSFL